MRRESSYEDGAAEEVAVMWSGKSVDNRSHECEQERYNSRGPIGGNIATSALDITREGVCFDGNSAVRE